MQTCTKAWSTNFTQNLYLLAKFSKLLFALMLLLNSTAPSWSAKWSDICNINFRKLQNLDHTDQFIIPQFPLWLDTLTKSSVMTKNKNSLIRGWQNLEWTNSSANYSAKGILCWNFRLKCWKALNRKFTQAIFSTLIQRISFFVDSVD